MTEHRHVYRPIVRDDPQWVDARCECGDVQTFSRYSRGRMVSQETRGEDGRLIRRYVWAES